MKRTNVFTGRGDDKVMLPSGIGSFTQFPLISVVGGGEEEKLIPRLHLILFPSPTLLYRRICTDFFLKGKPVAERSSVMTYIS